MPTGRLVTLTFLLLTTLMPTTGRAAMTAFRLSTLSFRDPHVYVSFLGCRDVTDAPLAGYSINGQIQLDLTTDSNSDGKLDLNDLIVFNPLDQSAAGGTLQLVTGECTAPLSGTQCQLGSGTTQSFSYQNHTTGNCLAPIAGTTFGYTPPIATPTNNCFATDPGTLQLSLAGLPMTLHDARIAGAYSGAPAASIVAGLIMGFISEADANATTLPSSLPLIGGLPLSRLFPGGSGNCAGHSDKDVKDGTPGWWIYLNYTAGVVPYSDGTTAVEEPDPPGAQLGAARPNPFRGSVTLDYSIAVAGSVRAWVTDLAGRRITTLGTGIQMPGAHALVWDGRDAAGARAPAGVYFIRVESLGRTSARRVALVR